MTRLFLSRIMLYRGDWNFFNQRCCKNVCSMSQVWEILAMGLRQQRCHGVMVAAPTWRPRRPLPLKGRMRPTRKAPPQRLWPQVRPGRWFVNHFLRVGDAPPAVAFLLLLLLLSGDVETNPGPSCYACGQNFRQSDRPLTSHTPDSKIRTHKETRCSGVLRSQQSLPWHCSTHGRPGPPVTVATHGIRE